MLIAFLFSILYASSFGEKVVNNDDFTQKSFSFMTSKNKRLILETPNKYLPKITFLSKFIRKLTRVSIGDWYYVHFLTSELEDISKNLKIKVEDSIIIDTFILYLTEDELLQISDISLVKKLLPEDKFQDSNEKLLKNNLFHVVIKPNSQIPIKSDLYSIEQQQTQDTYIIRVNPDNDNDSAFLTKKKQAIKFLSQIPEVKFISTYTPPTFSNSIHNGFTQKNQEPGSIQTDKTSNVKYLDRYVNNKGFTGAGQTITILDTPIDFYHAMFRDDKVKMQLNTPLKDHRKFVYYGSTSKSLAEWSSKLAENEHGTLMAGAAAGKSVCPNPQSGTSLFDGNAYDAKILYAGNPYDVSWDQLNDLMKSYDSYISSNSWGIDDPNDQVNYGYGNVAHNNPERLFLFAAGNNYVNKGYFSIGDPGSSKNVLTVGAIGSFYEARPMYKVESLTSGKSITCQAIQDTEPWIEGTFGSFTSNDITGIDATRGTQCHLLNSGHASIVYASNPASANWVYGCQLTSSTGILFSQSPGEVLALMNEGGKVKITDVTPIDKSAKVTHAAFSSAGPGSKGILKPDLVAPGTRIISAKSKHQISTNHGCSNEGANYTTTHGTSISTANIAGAAALIRQYFSSGKWKESVQLDGTTLRALLINSCKHPGGSKSPDVLYGHGVVDLSTVLPLENNFGVQITQTNSKKPTVGSQSFLSAKINVNPNGKPLQITLSYLDPMLESTSPIPISRDLDLVVISPSKATFKGDHLSNEDTQHFSTNEKIIIDNPEKGTYYIHVIGNDFIDSNIKKENQAFAVVASGPVSNDYITFEKPTTCPCATCDKSDPTKCACPKETQIGIACQSSFIQTAASQKVVNVGPLQMSRIYFKTKKDIKSITAQSNNGGTGSTVWVSPNCSISVGQYKANGQTGKPIAIDFAQNEVCVAIFNNNYQEAEYLVKVDGDGEDTEDPDDSGDSGGGKPKKKNNKGVIIGVVIAVIVVLAIVAVVVFIIIKRKKGDLSSSILRSGSFV